jgi:hypothetical protein
LITLPLLVFGLLLIALPSFVLGREFSLVWERMSKKRDYIDNGDPPVASPRGISPLPTGEDVATGQYPTSHKSIDSPYDLTQQISELRAAVDAQGVILNHVLDVLGQSKGKQRESHASPRS